MKTKQIITTVVIATFFVGAFHLYTKSNNKCDTYRMNQYMESRIGIIPYPALSTMAESLYCVR